MREELNREINTSRQWPNILREDWLLTAVSHFSRASCVKDKISATPQYTFFTLYKKVDLFEKYMQVCWLEFKVFFYS